jgi:metal-responsive CopG/Arc/MetJ family transcriptional regulator
MSARSVQISLDEKLLARVDRAPLARRKGRSAFIRAALESYLASEASRAIDEAYDRGYGGKAAERALAEFGPLAAGQSWPER